MASSVVKKASAPEYAYYDRISELKRKMPVSWLTLLGSFLIWALICWACYNAYIYGIMYMWMNDKDLQGACDEDFSETVEENLEKLVETPKGDSWPYFAHLGISTRKQRKGHNGKNEATIMAAPETMTFPPIVTAVTSDDFFWVQGLVRQVKEEVKPMFEDTSAVKFIIYEIGLTTSEKDILTSYCDCMVRSVEKNFYPAHVFNGHQYSWRPLFIQLILKEFGSALWVDPRARLTPDKLKDAVSQAATEGYLLWPTPELSKVVAYTDPSTFEYFKEKRCTFKDTFLIDTTAMLFYSKDLTVKGIMTPWLKCTLTQSCVSPKGAQSDACLHKREPLYTGCHNFGQSALSIVVNRLLLFSENKDKLVPSYRIAENISAIDTEYFPERPWTKSHQNYILYALILVILFSIMSALFGTFFLECLGFKFPTRKKSSPV